MDLTKNTTEDTSTLKLVSPDGQETDIELTLYSADSDVHDAAAAELRDELLRLPEDSRKTSPEKRRTIVARMYAKCTKDWKGVQWKGKDLEFSLENATMIYANPGLSWIRDQVKRFMEDRRRFLPQNSRD